MQAGRHRSAHQDVVAGVELDLVDAPSKAVMAVQLGREDVGQARVCLHLRRPQLLAEQGQRAGVELRRVERQRGTQRLVAGKQVVIDQGRGLVDHLVG